VAKPFRSSWRFRVTRRDQRNSAGASQCAFRSGGHGEKGKGNGGTGKIEASWHLQHLLVSASAPTFRKRARCFLSLFLSSSLSLCSSLCEIRALPTARAIVLSIHMCVPVCYTRLRMLSMVVTESAGNSGNSTCWHQSMQKYTWQKRRNTRYRIRAKFACAWISAAREVFDAISADKKAHNCYY